MTEIFSSHWRFSAVSSHGIPLLFTTQTKNCEMDTFYSRGHINITDKVTWRSNEVNRSNIQALNFKLSCSFFIVGMGGQPRKLLDVACPACGGRHSCEAWCGEAWGTGSDGRVSSARLVVLGQPASWCVGSNPDGATTAVPRSCPNYPCWQLTWIIKINM